MDDLEQRILADLDDTTWIYPGHGNDTTIGSERPLLPPVASTRLVTRPAND